VAPGRRGGGLNAARQSQYRRQQLQQAPPPVPRLHRIGGAVRQAAQ